MPDGVDIAVDTNYPTTQGNGHYIITLKDEEAFVYFTQVFDRATACDARTEALTAGTATKLPGESVHNNLNMWYGPNTQNIIVKMDCDVNLNGMTVKPFGMTNVNFDGNDHTIKNAKLTGASGFFADCIAVSNVTLDNIHVTATDLKYAGVVEGYNSGKDITNVTVKNSSVTGGRYAGALVGNNYGDVTGCTVEDTTVSGQYKVGGIAGYVCKEEPADEAQSITGNKLTNVTVKGENLWTGDSGFIIGKIVGHWNKQNNGDALCKDNTLTNVTGATEIIGKIGGKGSVTVE